MLSSSISAFSLVSPTCYIRSGVTMSQPPVYLGASSVRMQLNPFLSHTYFPVWKAISTLFIGWRMPFVNRCESEIDIHQATEFDFHLVLWLAPNSRWPAFDWFSHEKCRVRSIFTLRHHFRLRHQAIEFAYSITCGPKRSMPCSPASNFN